MYGIVTICTIYVRVARRDLESSNQNKKIAMYSSR